MATGADILSLAQRHIGEPYILGAFVPKDKPVWTGPWDCAEFTSWLVYQVTRRLYGCDRDNGPPAAADAFTGYWERDVGQLGRQVSVDEAASTPGAFLLRFPPATPPGNGHIVVSDGRGGTVEAMGAAYGVRQGSVDQRLWNVGVLIPWVNYTRSAVPVHVRPPGRLLREGDAGASVIDLQRALAAAGFDPGAIDGQFGPHTRAAVCAFQASRGLVVDGLVGRETAAALGL